MGSLPFVREGDGIPQATPTLLKAMTARGDRISPSGHGPVPGVGAAAAGLRCGPVGDGGNIGGGPMTVYSSRNERRMTGIAGYDMIRAHGDDNGAVHSFNKSTAAKLNYPAGRRALWSNSIAVSISRIIAPPVLPPINMDCDSPRWDRFFLRYSTIRFYVDSSLWPKHYTDAFIALF